MHNPNRHPTDEEIAAFVDDDTRPHGEILTHIDHCADCAELVLAVRQARDEEEFVARPATTPNQRNAKLDVMRRVLRRLPTGAPGDSERGGEPSPAPKPGGSRTAQWGALGSLGGLIAGPAFARPPAYAAGHDTQEPPAVDSDHDATDPAAHHAPSRHPPETDPHSTDSEDFSQNDVIDDPGEVSHSADHLHEQPEHDANHDADRIQDDDSAHNSGDVSDSFSDSHPLFPADVDHGGLEPLPGLFEHDPGVHGVDGADDFGTEPLDDDFHDEGDVGA